MAQEVPQNAFFHVEEVGGPGRKSALIQAFQCLGVAAHDAADGVFGGMTLILDQPFNLAGQRRIFDHQGVGAEDGAILAPEFFTDGFLIFPRLGGGGCQSLPQSGHLFLDAVFLDGTLRNPEQLGVQHEG